MEAHVCKIFKIETFKKFQIEAIQVLLKGNDVFVCQPTGSGKSLVFLCLPFFHGKVTNLSDNISHGKSDSVYISTKKCILVISPLESLMADQMQKLSKLGIGSIKLDTKAIQNVEAIINGAYPIIYASPEAVAGSYRKLLKSISDNIIAVAVDESHCIQKWGASDDKTEAFRHQYHELMEIRSLFASKTPVVALTATATSSTIDYIERNLNMDNPVRFVDIPEKSNIKYFVLKLSSDSPHEIFLGLIEQLRTMKYETPRCIIFCRRMNDIRLIYSLFNDHLCHLEYSDYADRPYAMYHSQTSDVIKNTISSSFSDPKGHVRILIATIAFGMGVDCKGLNKVIHYGPPSSVEDYFQEVGRAGRNGEKSFAVLIKYPGCTQSKTLKPDMKEYIKNDLTCRRKLLLRVFGKDFDEVRNNFCCDICASENSIDLMSILHCSHDSFENHNKESNLSESSEDDSDSESPSDYKCCIGESSSE